MKIVIPVKPFCEAKRRLGPALDADARAKLAEKMFRHVLGVAVECVAPANVLVVSGAPEILRLVFAMGATGLAESNAPGLNRALRQANEHARANGDTRLLIIASDLPLLCRSDLDALAQHDCAIAPDRHGHGTNALVWPTNPSPGFRFGKDSLMHHRAAAEECGFVPEMVDRPGLGCDIDYPEDLRYLRLIRERAV